MPTDVVVTLLCTVGVVVRLGRLAASENRATEPVRESSVEWMAVVRGDNATEPQATVSFAPSSQNIITGGPGPRAVKPFPRPLSTP
jgi:hypothetical protein